VSRAVASSCDAIRVSTIRSGCADNDRQHGTAPRDGGGWRTKNEIRREKFGGRRIFFSGGSRWVRWIAGACTVSRSPMPSATHIRNRRASDEMMVRGIVRRRRQRPYRRDLAAGALVPHGFGRITARARIAADRAAPCVDHDDFPTNWALSDRQRCVDGDAMTSCTRCSAAT
jgi:hypothetical protein